MKDIIAFIEKNHLGEVHVNKTFKELTTLKIGGKIKLYFLPYSINAFLKFYVYVKGLNIPIFIIGTGSNILASDRKYHGIVVSFKKIDVLYAVVGNYATVYAGCMMPWFVYQMANRNLGGIEFLSGIPGTLGGVVTMNAGAYGKSVSDYIISADCCDREGKIKTYTNEELLFGYRSSLVRMKDLIVLSAVFKLTERKSEEIKLTIKELMEKRKNTQPLKTLNAGCAFKNPQNFHAWALIDEVGMRGARINNAKISEKHANFFINMDNAKAKDMYKLMEITRKKVYQKFKIILINEWVLLNFKKPLKPLRKNKL